MLVSIHGNQKQLFFKTQGLVLCCCYSTAPQPLATTSRGLWVSEKRVLGDGCALRTLDVDSDRAEHVDGTVTVPNRPVSNRL